MWIVAALFAPIAMAVAEPAFSGILRAHDEAMLQSEVGGIVDRILVHEGEHVAEGQLLVQLKNERQRIALELSRTTLTKAEAQLTETHVMLESAEKELKRIAIAADALPRKDLEEHQDAVERLKATVAAQAAERAQTEQEVRLREHELKETEIVAPFAGAITQIKVHRGDALKPMEGPVLELVNLHALYVEVLVPSGAARRLQIGQPASVHVERESMSHAGQAKGRVSYINPTVDAASRTVRIKVDIESPNDAVRPGMLAEVQFD